MKNNIHLVEEEELMAYLDGELPVERAAATAAHLRECRECQILSAELKSVSESLTAWEIESNEPQINAELAAALDEREKQTSKVSSERRWTWLGRGRFAPFAGGALVGGVAMLLVAFALTLSVPRSVRESSRSASVAQTASQPNDAIAPGEVQLDGGSRDRLAFSATLAKRQELVKRQAEAQLASNLDMSSASAPGPGKAAASVTPSAPMILRTAQLTVVVQNLDKARTGMDQVVKRYGGYLGDLTTSSPSDGARKLTASVRLPSAQLDAAMAELKIMGHVESESQSGQDVTAQYVDLEARLSNARKTEQRLIDLLQQRTGKLSDVLEVETELGRVREEVERMEGERRLLSKQVEYATLNATISEEFKAPAQALPDSTGTRFRNAAVDGYQSVVNFIIGVALFLIGDGPMLLLWIAILYFPARYGWKKFRNRDVPSAQ